MIIGLAILCGCLLAVQGQGIGGGDDDETETTGPEENNALPPSSPPPPPVTANNTISLISHYDSMSQFFQWITELTSKTSIIQYSQLGRKGLEYVSSQIISCQSETVTCPCFEINYRDQSLRGSWRGLTLQRQYVIREDRPPPFVCARLLYSSLGEEGKNKKEEPLLTCTVGSYYLWITGQADFIPKIPKYIRWSFLEDSETSDVGHIILQNQAHTGVQNVGGEIILPGQPDSLMCGLPEQEGPTQPTTSSSPWLKTSISLSKPPPPGTANPREQCFQIKAATTQLFCLSQTDGPTVGQIFQIFNAYNNLYKHILLLKKISYDTNKTKEKTDDFVRGAYVFFWAHHFEILEKEDSLFLKNIIAFTEIELIQEVNLSENLEITPNIDLLCTWGLETPQFHYCVYYHHHHHA